MTCEAYVRADHYTNYGYSSVTNDTGAIPSVSCSFTPGAYVPTTYTLTYTKYSDNTGSPPGAQKFQPNVTNVTIQGRNTLAKSTSTNLSYTVTFDPNGGSTSKTSETNTRKRTTSYNFEG